VCVALQSKEGLISEGSTLWESLSPADQKKRQAATAAKASKLKSPNFYVSPTRLHVLNIPLAWDSKDLKACCRSAVLARATKAQPKIKQVRCRLMTELGNECT
jgi:nucleolar protein 4